MRSVLQVKDRNYAVKQLLETFIRNLSFLEQEKHKLSNKFNLNLR